MLSWRAVRWWRWEQARPRGEKKCLSIPASVCLQLFWGAPLKGLVGTSTRTVLLLRYPATEVVGHRRIRSPACTQGVAKRIATDQSTRDHPSSERNHQRSTHWPVLRPPATECSTSPHPRLHINIIDPSGIRTCAIHVLEVVGQLQHFCDLRTPNRILEAQHTLYRHHGLALGFPVTTETLNASTEPSIACPICGA